MQLAEHTTVQRIDLRSQLKHLFVAKAGRASLLDVPPLSFLMVDGQGGPDAAAFGEAVSALFSVAYSLKFAFKKGAQPVDYPVMGLEGLWWTESGTFDLAAPDDWRWTLMIVQPDVVTAESLTSTVSELKVKKPLLRLDDVRLERFEEGRSAQVLHVGPYATEPETIELLHQFIAERGLAIRGKHHEIYLSDPRRCAPERLKTIIRYPVA